ncbi:transcriptional regulator [Ameyamaea chiangmaiensis NBRC 103196]|uniref:LysR family transcriptional regulator n=1 Tax=Ameyamaea chiangmaiensis TaxID=442969 RepID=A0A850PAE7_9PROT|nr:LysR family transcriptional regulator [Ameyamaea chiangmaiensis]MBS4073925.1 LysR family transcriptional regulator [Ameyamaea chiangmaiensis]NVN39923.1 LysR family transcriptional regulator [Ameyamaea chiangmaiensis]GBQ67910.1 transcriptional regulator [Ameyamaea chiangmaiensis NBRC 103196]
MNIKFLETFLAVQRLRSFRLAAETSHISQAAVSNRIAALEAEFGCMLFDRRSREFILTDAGQRLIRHATEIVNAQAAMRRDVQGSASAPESIRVGAVGSMAHAVMPAVSKAAQYLQPRLRIVLQTAESNDLLEALCEQRLDIVVARAGIDRPGLDSSLLCTFAMFWVGSGATLKLCELPLRREQLLHLPLVSYSADSPAQRQLLAYLQVQDSSELQISHSDSLATLVQFVRHDLGVAPLPAAAVMDELARNEVHLIPSADALPPATYALYTRERREPGSLPALMRLIREQVSQFCASLPDGYAQDITS